MALPTNSFKPKRYFRSKFREGKYLLASEATDLQLESHDLLREFLKLSYGNFAVQSSWKAEQMTLTQLRVRPGSAWDNGVPYLMKSGSDPKVIAGILPTGIALVEASATTLDAGGKNLNLSGALANDNYSVVVEATEELVRPVGTGAVDPYLQGTNVGEETANKLRLIYKLNVVKTADLSSTPTFPLGVGVNHLVNEIVVTPQTGVANFLISAVPIAQDVNGADVRITLDNANGNLPFSTDADDYINGVFVDSDGNEMTITSITTTDAGATVKILLDREVDYNSALPKAALPIITNLVPYKLVKRDFYVSAGSGQPLGRHFYRIADFTSVGGSLTSLEDKRIVTGINTFGVDHNVRLVDGGIISWNSITGDLTWDTDFQVTIPGVTGSAVIPSPAGIINIPSDGMIAFCYLDRSATSDYNVTLTVLAKDQVPPSVDVYNFAERRGGRIYFPHGGSIGNGETGILGAFGATLDKDFSQDLIVDALSENGLSEVFAETFDTQDNVDLSNTVGVTYEPFAKQYRATAAARFLDYEGDVTPDSGTLPVDEIWTKVGTQVQSVGGGLLNLSDTSIGDQIAYSRTESNLTTLSQADFSFRLRQNSNGGEGGNYFTYMIKDGPSGKHFGLGITGTSVDLIDGAGTVLQTYALAVNTMHTYRLVKIGNSVVQWYVDNILRGVYTYSSIATGSGGVSTITWGTTIPTTQNWDIDYVRFNIYLSIVQSLDVFRETSLFYNASVLPAADTPAWTKIGGAGGITEVITNGKLVLTDPSALNSISYERSESTLIRQGDAELEMRIKIDSAGRSSFDKFGLKLQDGKKDAALYVRDAAGQLKAGIWNAASATLVSLEHDIDSDKYVVLKLRKVKDEGYQLFIDGLVVDSIAYDEISDITANQKMIFGSFNIASNYTCSIDYVQYALPGAGLLAGTPVHDFLTIVSSDDPFPKSWVSTDKGLSWHEMIPDTHTSVTDFDYAGGNILVRIMLSAVDSVLTDYGILYNVTAFETEGQFNYDKQTATALQTSFILPWTYTPGSNELEVYYRPLGSGHTRKLTKPEDYTEANQSTVDLTFTTVAGDILEFKNTFVESPLVPPPVRFINHNHDGSRGESDVLYPTQIFLGPNDINVNNLIPIGSIIPHYDFNGLVSFDTNIYVYCDGSVLSDAASPLNGQTLPDMSNRYLVGFGTEAGGDIDSAVFSSSPVGNASHQINLQHSHTVSSHSHGPGTLQFPTGDSVTGAAILRMFDSGAGTHEIARYNSDVIQDAGDNSRTYLTNPFGAASTQTFFTRVSGSTGSSGTSSPGMDSQLSTTQTIQPRSIRVRFIMRKK